MAFENQEQTMKKKQCWACNSSNVIKWGRQKEKQRYKCKDCGIIFTNNDRSEKIRNRMIWFEKWMLEKKTFRSISKSSGYSIDTLQRTFYKVLQSSPPKKRDVKIFDQETDFIGYIQSCFEMYPCGFGNYLPLADALGKFCDEQVKDEIIKFLHFAIKVEKQLFSDGIKIKNSFIDRKKLTCILVICFTWLLWFPKSICEQELREIFLQLLRKKNQANGHDLLLKWYGKYKQYIFEKTENPDPGNYKYKYPALRNIFFIMRRMTFNVFEYHKDQENLWAINEKKLFFFRMKDHLDFHKGLILKNKINFMKWFAYLYIIEKKI